MSQFNFSKGESKNTAHHNRKSDSSSIPCRTRSRRSPRTPKSPRSPRTPAMFFEDKRFDPYQRFKVEHKSCMILHVHVVCGRNISNGWQDYLDTPDPYILLRMRSAPDGKRRTKTMDNEVNPTWNEKFDFLLDDVERNILQITLMEDNYGPDQTIGTVYFDTAELTFNKYMCKTFIFNDTSEVDFKFMIEYDTNPTLRYSLCLCDEEKEFLTKRREKVFEAMQRLLGDNGPKDLHEVPRIAVLGSGGGFRAMVAYSGVFKALYESGILDCTTYACGLSGSSWYLSTLYSHQNWPNMNPKRIMDELKNNIEWKLIWLMGSVRRYLETILKKRNEGQPISFTDFFGHMVGETLLKDRRDCKLSDQKEKINGGETPMPMYTCVHVKEDRSARSFQEWVEFSPYEIGMPKYGTFMKPELFGSKFFLGKLCRQFEEPPLHFLQGIWGSAFCILFKRLLEDNRKLDPVEMIRQEMAKELENKTEDDDASDCSDDDEEDHDYEEIKTEVQEPFKRPVLVRGTKALDNKSNGKNKPLLRRMPSMKEKKRKSYWSSLLDSVLHSERFELLHTRKGRAGVIHNFMRGLNLQKNYPMSPFTPRPREADEFDGIFEMHPTTVKHLYMVDAGLTFNSPYPLMLRPQRGIDIILSFDFSARPSDTSPPFKELLLAEKWAKMNHLKFPKIDTTVFDRDGMKELYIFKDPKDPACPVVFHFVLVNIEFRKYEKPGVPRDTEKQKFADFDIFDDQATPYSTFNFTYTNEQFERLSQLMEFNTLLHVDDIKSAITERIQLLSKHNFHVCSPEIDKQTQSRKCDKKKMKDIARTVDCFRISVDETSPKPLILKPILKRPALKRQKEVSITTELGNCALSSPTSDQVLESKNELEKRLRFKDEHSSSDESDVDKRRKAFRREETQWFDANQSLCSPDIFKSFDYNVQSPPIK